MRSACLQGLWRGTLAGQLLYVPYTVVQFVTLQQVNLAARRWNLTETWAAPLISYASGAAAGMAATCASYPFDLLRTTLAAQGEPKVNIFMLAWDLAGAASCCNAMHCNCMWHQLQQTTTATPAFTLCCSFSRSVSCIR